MTQNPIPPGGSFRYDFPLKQSGTYWMHSHYGLQEQLFNSAPMIIWTPEERSKQTGRSSSCSRIFLSRRPARF